VNSGACRPDRMARPRTPTRGGRSRTGSTKTILATPPDTFARTGMSFVENRLPLWSTKAHWASQAALVNTTRSHRETCGHEHGSIFVALPGTFRQLLSEASRHLLGDLKALDGPESRGDCRRWFSRDQAPIPRAELGERERVLEPLARAGHEG